MHALDRHIDGDVTRCWASLTVLQPVGSGFGERRHEVVRQLLRLSIVGLVTVLSLVVEFH